MSDDLKLHTVLEICLVRYQDLLVSIVLTLYVAVTQFTIGKWLRKELKHTHILFTSYNSLMLQHLNHRLLS